MNYLKLGLSASFAAAVIGAPAYAQSSVLLYGLIDDGLSFNSNAGGHHQVSMNVANLDGNRWGLRGLEDLGGGLQTIFVLEGGYNLNTGALGQGGAIFGRQAFVGLVSPTLGQFTVGRQYDVMPNTVSSFMLANIARRGGIGAQLAGVISNHPGDIDALGNSFHVNSALKYISPVWSGFKFVGVYGLGGVSGDFSRNQIWSIGSTYSNGPFNAGLAFEKINDPNASYYGGNPNGSPTANNITGGADPIFSGYASAKTQQIGVAGVSYAIGAATIGAMYSNVRFTDLGADGGAGLNPNDLSGTANFNIGEINFTYNLSPAWIVGIGCTYTAASSFKGESGARYKQLNFGADYALSKRTDIYFTLSYEKASGVDSTGKPAVAILDGIAASSTGNQLGMSLGIRTYF